MLCLESEKNGAENICEKRRRLCAAFIASVISGFETDSEKCDACVHACVHACVRACGVCSTRIRRCARQHRRPTSSARLEPSRIRVGSAHRESRLTRNRAMRPSRSPVPIRARKDPPYPRWIVRARGSFFFFVPFFLSTPPPPFSRGPRARFCTVRVRPRPLCCWSAQTETMLARIAQAI